jgi:hypothetical protein
MGWEVETEPEVTQWYLNLTAGERDVATMHVDLLAEFGHGLRMPHSKPLGQGLFELRLEMSAGRGASATASDPTRSSCCSPCSTNSATTNPRKLPAPVQHEHDACLSTKQARGEGTRSNEIQ